MAFINTRAQTGTRCRDLLTECGVEIDRVHWMTLSEDSKLQVTDETILGMMRFITDKYNSLDFKEIEKSAGDIDKFKYTRMLRENVETLRNIYKSSPDPGASNYVEVTDAVAKVLDHLQAYRGDYADLYRSGNGVIQLLYTSLVAGCIYSIGVLISNTIRFVTTETETDCQVLFDEIPGTLKHVHIKNIQAAANDVGSYEKVLATFRTARGNKALKESVSMAALIAAASVAAAIFLLPRLLIIIREIIYSIYFTRVKLADMIGVQVDLINTNIESLSAGRGTPKVIARQRKIADKLAKWQKRIAVNMDSTTSLVNAQRRQESSKLKVGPNSPVARDPSYYTAGDLML